MKKSVLLLLVFTVFSPFAALENLSATTYEQACRVMKAENIVSGDFIQKRTIAVNGRTLKSSGVFTVSAEKIIWETTKPIKNKVIITQGKITHTDSKGKTTALDGTENAMFELSSKMIASLLSGNREEFEEYFEVDFISASDGESWTMKLTPKDSTFSQGVSHINLAGNSKVLNSMETILRTKDSILYEFTNQRFN